VPLHWRRLWTRRFNQAAALSKAISEDAGVPVLFDTLRRVRSTPQQIGLSKTDRASNVQGAFRVPPERKATIAGRRVILIDDVLTSGATVDTCAKALLKAGAANVDVLCFRTGFVAAGARPRYKLDWTIRNRELAPRRPSTPPAGAPIATWPRRC